MYYNILDYTRDLDYIDCNTHQDSGILDDKKWAWWKAIFAIPERITNPEKTTKCPISCHLLEIRDLYFIKKFQHFLPEFNKTYLELLLLSCERSVQHVPAQSL